MDLEHDNSCSMYGAAQKTAAEGFECVMGTDPGAWANFFGVLIVVVLIIFWLRISWQSLHKKNKGVYGWEEVMDIFTKLLGVIVFMAAFLVWVIN